MKRRKDLQTVTVFPALILIITLSAATSSTRKKAVYNFSPARPAMLSITQHESQHHVKVLASDRLEGRATGTRGQWLAAKYIATEFSKYGLEAAGQNGKYYQDFNIVRPGLKKTSLVITKPTGESNLLPKQDFIPFNFTGENEITAPVVFAGYGITAPELGYDDYQKIDVKGKIVLVMRHEPQEHNPQSKFNGTILTEHALFEQKAINAKNHGAAAMLLITDPKNHRSLAPQGYWPSLNPRRNLRKRWQLQRQNGLEDFPVLWIGSRTTKEILEDTGFTMQSLQESIDLNLQPKSFLIPKLQATVVVKLNGPKLSTQNVLGLLPGSDSKLREEVVVIGAHYDHIGIRNGQVYNGADDNASGTTGLLEIAEAFSELTIRPRRSILFAAFSAEELGLLGSKFYVENPVMPLKQTVAMINLDMIARNSPNDVSIIGSKRSPELHEINIAANHEIGLDLIYNGERYFERSDQANFARRGIPVIFYNTDDHHDYHRPSDTVEKINAAKLVRIARLAFLVGWEVANTTERPSYHSLE